jgi:hypothetical protein
LFGVGAAVCTASLSLVSVLISGQKASSFRHVVDLSISGAGSQLAHWCCIACFNGMDSVCLSVGIRRCESFAGDGAHLVRLCWRWVCRPNEVKSSSPWCWNCVVGGGANLIRLCGRWVCRPNEVKSSSPWCWSFVGGGGANLIRFCWR